MTDSPSVSPELRRLGLLREFKLRVIRKGAENASPFTERIVTTHADRSRIDVEGLHREVRDNIALQIAAVRDHQRSQVVLLSGEAGAGKSHILRHFAQPTVAEEHGYIFVGGSNDWKVSEFQPCLLDWMIAALTAPAPSEEHLLLARVRAIGFRAIGQLLENRTALKRCTAKRRRRFLGLLGGRRASYETIEKLTKERNPEVFELLDFTKFGEEVCSRFLAEPSNPVHRYALRVLLTYLFPDAGETGLGTRDRVLNWFRRRPDGGYWVKRFGVSDDLDRRYAVADAIKLLIHLFSPDLSRRLSVDGDEHRPFVFLFVFDQAEGRDELFDSFEDWNHFFAHLSELYNTLPNVLVLFTMTLGLRNELHPKMERQFKDRIRKDERFVLRQPTPDEIQTLYRARLAGWLSDDLLQQGLYTNLPEADQYLPFDADKVVAIAGTQSVRAALEALDPAFREALGVHVIEPLYDFEYVVHEQQELIEKQSEWDYTSEHLDETWELIEPLTDALAAEYGGVRLQNSEEVIVDTLPLLKFTFLDPAIPSSWVCVYLARFGKHYNAHIARCAELLKGKRYARYSVWMLRAREMSQDFPKPDQMFGRLIPPDTVARLWAAKHLLDKRAEYEKNDTWADAWKVIRDEIKRCYLGELFAHARDRVNAIKGGALADDPAGSEQVPT
ncbi:MAG: ATP-binding protein [Planctomycetes bacterium]|nr:ATP-binding protein [Planctomycetota bacterium]